jgi:FtsP/CotA-like multicopper oxidase with cupredoxin domain
MSEAQLSRRDVLTYSVFGAAALALPLGRVVRAKSVSQIAASRLPAPYTVPFSVPPVIDRRTGGSATIKQQLAQVEILPGFKTTIFGYNGVTPGPTVHARRGSPISVRMENRLPGTHPQWGYVPWTSCHLHGSASKPQYDGYASDITNPGQVKTYRYPNKQDARTLWYHDHGVHHTAENAYMGLAAQYHLHDTVEDGLPIPKWDFAAKSGAPQYDLPLILADKMFGSDGNFRYDDAGHSGVWGDVILVNGRPWPVLKVARRKYRFRVLNASLSRGYRLQLGDGSPMTVIGTDGGLMPRAQQTTQLRIGMAERYEVVIDFARYPVGATIDLRNLGVPNSVDYDNTDKIMRFEVTGAQFDTKNNDVPTGGDYSLNPDTEVWALSESQSAGTTKIEVVRNNGMWKILAVDAKGVQTNMTWEDVVNSGYRNVVSNPKLGDVQVWEIKNSSGGWFHPVHIHLVDFKILDRNGKAPYAFEQGPKDVAYIGENETVRAIMRFGSPNDTDVTGRYMIHCHNLPHEDHDMMTQFRVGEDMPGNDPINADPAKKI